MRGIPHRRRLSWQAELLLAMMPTATVLGVLALVEVLSNQRLLFASLASSAFLIYLDPEHSVNKIRTLVLAQLGASLVGWAAFTFLGPGYLSGGVAMIVAIAAMILLDVMYPPAVSTALSFALKAGNDSNVLLFSLAVAMTAGLVILQKAVLWMLRRVDRQASSPETKSQSSRGTRT